MKVAIKKLIRETRILISVILVGLAFDILPKGLRLLQKDSVVFQNAS